MSKSFEEAFPIPLGINWHEGMLLSQHHFQQNDIRTFALIAHQIKLLSPHHYGVCHLVVDPVALSAGIFKVDEMEAVFPDGLIIYQDKSYSSWARPIEINLAEKMREEDTECTVLLVIAKGEEGVSPLLGNPPRFYSIEGEYVEDENVPNNSVKIPKLVPNVFLHIGTLAPERCLGFPLGKIQRSEGVYHIKNWTPCCFFIEKNFPLWERSAQLAMTIREKVLFLTEKLRNEMASGVATDTKRLLEQLLEILPVFESLVYSDHIKPYDLYQELAHILGAVSVFQPLDTIPLMAPYDHDDIDGCTYPMIQLIDRFLSVIERGFKVIAFNKKERFFYYYVSKNDRFENNKIYIGVKWPKRGEYIATENWIKEAIIVSDFAIEAVRSKRIKGAARSLAEESAISMLLPGSGIVLLEVIYDLEFIKPEQNLHIFNPGDSIDTRPLEIVIYMPRMENLLR